MTQTPSDTELRKILKDNTNKKMLCLLGGEKEGKLTSVYLMTALNVTPRLFDYHLKVLADFIVKTDDDKYALSEKGKQAYDKMDELSKTFGATRKWKALWFVTTVSLLTTTFCVWSIFDWNPSRLGVRFIMSILFVSPLVYYFKVKPELAERAYYVVFGAGLLGSLLFLLMLFINVNGGQWSSPTSNHLTLVISFIICWIIGGVVGDLIGRYKQYKWPPFFINSPI